MVQYVITPWRDRSELLKARDALYQGESTVDKQAQYKAVALVSVWAQRGNCPHLIESTALLVSAILNDKTGNPAYAMRAGYSTAFCRFVTGLLDGYQDKKHKMSMYSIAKSIGLPATFVELRHQCTHEELPSLPKLRTAAEKSLAWIWEHYWKSLGEESPQASTSIEDLHTTLKEYMSWRASEDCDDEEQREEFAKRFKVWDTVEVLEVLEEFGDPGIGEPGLMLQSLRLTRAILSGEADQEIFDVIKEETSPAENHPQSLEEIRADMARVRQAMEAGDGAGSRQSKERDSEDGMDEEEALKTREESSDDEMEEGDTGWKLWEGPWIPRPIGEV